jgi:phosphoglycolate phosphatase-like HAD superfamily hydrolase
MQAIEKKKLIVFDMDGVLIDVSRSYRDTVRKTIRLFFDPAPASSSLPEPFFELSDLATVKQSGGLNNDWDLTFVVINLLFSLLAKPASSGSKNPWRRFKETMQYVDVSPIADFFGSTDKPLATLLAQKGRPQEPFITGLYSGEVGGGNIIKQIFQEIYLGRDLFKTTYRLEPEMYAGEGYILREAPFVDRPALEALSEHNILAIATGRPEAEAEYPLNSFSLKDFFKAVYTLDDCKREEKRILKLEGTTVSLSKPHPFMLDAIAEAIDEKVGGYYYVGDMPDDILAAKSSRSGFKGIGMLLSATDKDSLKNKLSQAGADHVVGDFDALKAFIETER